MKTLILSVLIVFSAQTAIAAPVQVDPTTRRLWDTDYLKTKSKPTTSKTPTPRRRYRMVTPLIPANQVAGDTVLGITIWRLRPSRATDDKEVRILKHRQDKSKTEFWTPERIPADTPLATGQRVRLSVEAARTGYLYVINREQFADGTVGDPYLVFPSTNLRGGDNQVMIGRIIDLPAPEDDPSYFTLEPSRSDQVGEIISVIVAPKPLPDLKIGEREIQLPNELVATWEKMWGTGVGRLELMGGAGKTWTKEEKAASAAKAQLLKRNAPSPQTLYYRPHTKPDDPLLVSLQLRYGTVKTAAQQQRK